MQQGPLTAETHTGMVFLVGDRAYKVKKPVVTDFLDFSTLESRERACAHELELNSRLAPDSYLGIGHFTPPGGGPSEPVLVMRRHPDERRLATMVRRGDEVEPELGTIALVLARFHASAARGREVDAEEAIAVVESVKAASDVYAPIAGEVVAVNEALSDSPEVINSDAYGAGWLLKMKIEDGALDDMLDVDAYQAVLDDEG